MSRRFSVVVLPALLALSGCYTSSTSPAGSGKSSAPASDTPQNSAAPAKKVANVSADGDITQIPIMTEVDGIEIPRIKTAAESLQLTGAVQVDEFNPHARQNPKEKATGDRVIVRFNAEPKTLNPITENSAYKSYILERNVLEPLARRNMETFEFEPSIADRWVIEDSVKLSPDYPGRERRIKSGDGEPQPQIGLEYTAPAPGDDKADPPIITVTTLNKDGQPVPGVWVGVYPREKIVGAPATGYHTWSDEQGVAKLSGYPTGKYLVKVGAEVYGKTVKEADGSLTITPASNENPLQEELKSTPNSTLTLKPDEWIERHEQTYYTYYLRPEVKWSDGTPFTAKDLEFTLAVINNPAVDGDHNRAYYQDLVECRALSPHVVRMRYRQQYFLAQLYTAELAYHSPPWHYFSQFFQKQGKELTLERLTPEQEEQQKKISAHGQQFGQFFNQNESYNRAPLGTGPYIVDLWENSDRIEVRRNPDYWDPTHAGWLDRLVYKFIIDANGVLPALQSGVIDFATRLNQEQYFEVLQGPPDWFAKDYVKAEWFAPAFQYIGWNELNLRFQDRRVRIALGMLFDKRRFLETKMHNAGVIVSGPSYYFGPDYDHRVAPLEYAPETTRDLLTEAGWIDSNNNGILDKDGVEFTIKALFPRGNPLVVDLMALLKNEMKSVGIDMDIQTLEWASFLEKVKARDFDVVTLSWAMDPVSDPHQIWHGSGAGKKSRGSNHVSFNNPKADELIDLIRVTIDPLQRQQYAYAFHRLIDSEQPYQFLYCPKELGAYHKRFRGVKWYRLRPGYELREWYVPKDEQLR